MSKRLKLLASIPPHDPAIAELRRRGDLEMNLIDEPPPRVGERVPWPINDGQAEADLLLCSGFAPENLDRFGRLKWVQLASAGYETFVGLGLPARGIRATNALGVFDIPIAEWNVAMMINLVRDLRDMIRNQERGHWQSEHRYQTELRGKTVGFWGYGGIARETARIAKHMGLRIHVLSRSGVRPRGETYVVPGTGDPDGKLPDKIFSPGQIKEFLGGLDFLIVAMPLTDATRGVIGEAELRALPRHAFVLNPARGHIIQEQALLRALRENWIAGAAIDTHYAYPLPPEHPLWKFPNVILTPHISGSGGTQKYLERVWDIFTQNLDRFTAGRPLLNELSAEQLQGR